MSQKFNVSAESRNLVFRPTPSLSVPRRPAIVRFTHNGQPVQPQGNIHFNCSNPTNAHRDNERALDLQPVLIEVGLAILEVPVPATSLDAEPDGLIGFWFREKWRTGIGRSWDGSTTSTLSVRVLRVAYGWLR